MHTDYSTEAQQRIGRDVERWNRFYPVGTVVGVRLGNGSIGETRTRTPAQVFEDSERQPVATVYLEGVDGPVMLADCLPEIPKELKFLSEQYTAEKDSAAGRSH